MAIKIGDLVNFKEELFFDGAVQADWFYDKDKADLVSRNYVFHGSEYFGVKKDDSTERNVIDTISFTSLLVNKIYNDEDENINPFTLAIAGYGAGKSHLAVTIASLFANLNQETVNAILNNIYNIDSKTGNSLRTKVTKKNLVLTINGMNDINLNYEILRSAKRSLKYYGLSDDILTKISSAYETAKRFTERQFSINTKAFEVAAQRHGINLTGNSLFQYIGDNIGFDESIYDVVNEVYSEVTGHEIRWDQGISAGQILEILCNEFCISQGLFNKVVLIFDEFGRYLEYASEYKSKAGDSALQQIFEAAQNTDGNIQFIGFIQSDIKTYLTRVEQTSNISRYIGRYNRSEKVYLSSNLETIFANIIGKPNKDLYQKTISENINKNKTKWIEFHTSLCKWIPSIKMRGAWSDPNLFCKVIVEGTYPFHPLSTYMLSSMSDWLQNRSSLALLNNKIREFSNNEVNEELSLIYPVDILDDSLFIEILSAEEEGRQRSRYATIYDNVIKKYNDRLTAEERLVLKANLILKICRINNSSKSDLISSIESCTDLDEEVIVNALEYLEEEYGVISYDERACSYEFVEDSMGASDFRAFIKRKTHGAEVPVDIFIQEDIKRIAGVLNPIDVDFSVKKYITTSEWQFDQSLYFINDYLEDDQTRIINDLSKRFSVDKAKGYIIWLYVNKNSDSADLIRIQELIKQVPKNLPLRYFLLDDSDNYLNDCLINYIVATNITSEDSTKYGKYLLEFTEKSVSNLTNAFETLRVERKLVTDKEVLSEGLPRLPIYLSLVFEQIYPKTMPFTFDGFAGKSATITKTRKLLCSIERFLCWDNSDYQSIKTQPIEVQKRFDSILSGAGPMSWKVITKEGNIVPPKHPAAAEIYDLILQELDTKQSLGLESIVEKLRRPPYGANDMAISLFLIVFLVIQKFRIKLHIGKEKYNLSKWADIVATDTVINIDAIKNTYVVVSDSVDVRRQYKSIFDEINGNTNPLAVARLRTKLEALIQEEDLPEDLKDSHTLATIKLDNGRRAKQLIESLFSNCKEIYERYKEEKNLYSIIKFTEENMYIPKTLSDGYIIADNEINLMNKNIEHFMKIIENNLINWADQNIRIRNIDNIRQFEGWASKIETLLSNLGFREFANHVKSLKDRELANIEAIRERQLVGTNINTFLSKSLITDTTSINILTEWKKKTEELKKYLSENNTLSPQDKKEFEEKLLNKAKTIDDAIEIINNQLNEIENDLFDAENNADLLDVKNKIQLLLKRELKREDAENLLTTLSYLNSYFELDQTYNLYPENRQELARVYEQLSNRFKEDAEYDLTTVIEIRFQEIIMILDDKESLWLEKYTKGLDFRNHSALQKWQNDTRILPIYLSDEAIKQYEMMRNEVEKALRDFKFDYVLDLIKELTREDWARIKQIVDSRNR